MLLRWLILHLAATRAEIRLVLRALRTRVFEKGEHGHHGDTRSIKLEKRIARSPRLALLMGILTVHAENPRLVASAIVVLPTAIVLFVLWLAGMIH